MATNVRRLRVVPLCAVAIAVLGTVTVPAAQAENQGGALFGGVNVNHTTIPNSGEFPTGLCGGLGHHPQLAAAAQRHANDMLKSGVTRHTGSDGSTPDSRISDAGVTFSRHAEIVYMGTGSAATTQAALNLWMNASPPHRAIILDCGLTAAGAATASDGNKMTAVVDFIGP